MDQSYSEGDITLSPSQLLERLQLLRQLQLLQRGKLQKQRLEYQETSESYETSCITEMISHFTNSNSSTSYNTFRSQLQSPQSKETPRLNASDISQIVKERDLIDGVSVLNLSKESEFVICSPGSTDRAPSNNGVSSKNSGTIHLLTNKQISLDEMPILSPRKDFEALVVEKLQMDINRKPKSPTKTKLKNNNKKQFLKRGEGMARFGVKKNDLVIQNTKSLPWISKKKNAKPTQSTVKAKSIQVNKKNEEKLDVEILNVPKLTLKRPVEPKQTDMSVSKEQLNECIKTMLPSNNLEISDNKLDHCNIKNNKVNKIPEKILQMPKGKHPILATKGKTWAAVLTKEQNDFLSKLKQSDYYKNFASPSKSTVSDISCDENVSKVCQEKESAEQKLFELLENKVTNESFNLENSFFSRFLRRSNLECSGESTPLVMQKCLANNPNLMHIFPEIHKQNSHCNDTASVLECCSDTCSSVSSCCSCKTIEPATPEDCIKKKAGPKIKEVPTENNDRKHQDDSEIDTMKANMAEMNAKLVTTSELLKERLCELEDEIETFRKENVNLNKLREEVDMERQKFYEEKNSFEQKFNEEKVLSEYYLAEEKEKISKQKQTYERYVREMRGRLNKKEKDEVVNLKQEIANLKEEIRVKDAKSTSTIARLRNQIKIMEKEKADFQAEVEKLKKENRRIQHSNDITRRLTNMKYLEQINKKLSNMTKQPSSEIEISTDTKYKAFEIERQSRTHKREQASKNTIRPRAKSVPNLKVTSRYAKYFSQKDALSERNNVTNYDKLNDEILNNDISDDIDTDSVNEIPSDSEENHLEKIYMETFRPLTNSKLKSYDSADSIYNDFFLRKSNSRDSKSPSISQNSLNRSKSPVSVISHKPINLRPDIESSNSHRSKSPISIINNPSRPRSQNNDIRQSWPSDDKPARSSNDQMIRSNSPSVHSNHSSLKSGTVILNGVYKDKLSVSPEPSKTSLTKTSLNSTEIRKSDGSRELRFPNGNLKYISPDGKYTKFVYYNGDVKENFLSEGRIKYYYAETKTYHTTHADGLEVLEFPDGQVEKRYADGSSEVRLPNGSIRYHDPKNEQVREEWRFPDGAALTISASGQQRVAFSNGQVEVHDTDHKRREFPDGTVKLVYTDGTSETRYASGRVRIKDKHGNLIMDSATR